MKIFTDASITKNKEGKLLFSTHAVVIFTNEMEHLETISFTTEVNTPNIVVEENRAIMKAIEKADKHTVIYTDSKQSVTNTPTEIQELLDEKQVYLVWIPRELNYYADAVCSKLRNEELSKIKEKENLPRLRKIEVINKEYSETFKDTFKTTLLDLAKNEQAMLYKQLFEKGIKLNFEVRTKSKKASKFLDTSLTQNKREQMYENYKRIIVADKQVSKKAFLQLTKNTKFFGNKDNHYLFMLKIALNHHDSKDFKNTKIITKVA